MATTFERKGTMVPVPATLPAVNGKAEPAAVKGGRIWGVLRISLGWVFLWAFLDKMFALGFATGRNAETGAIDFFGPEAWINGGSPTAGFLEFGTKGPFAGFLQGLDPAWVNWVFMLSLFAIGTALVLGIGARLAAIGGAIWMVMLYAASAIWPENNPFMDDHLIYAIALIGLAYVGAGRYLGFGRWWESTALVRRFPVLK